MSRRAVAAGAVGVPIAGVLAWTGLPAGDGVVWRAAFVIVSLGGTGLLVIALRQWSPSALTVLTVAVLLRAAVFPMHPTLSDDGYRYVWDGVVQAQGLASPYALTPADSTLASLQGEEMYRRMNSRDYYSVYPPLSQAVFWVGGWLYPSGWQASWYTIKGVTVLAELAGVLALLRLVSPASVALYAWNPLAVVEVAGQGHTEGLLVGALGLLLLASRRRSPWAGVALAAAGWVKLFPFAIAPAVLLRGGGRTLLTFAGTAGLLAAPFVSVEAVDHVRQSVRLYLGTFDFYSAPYLLLKSALYPLWGDPAGSISATALSLVWAVGAAALALTADGSFRSVQRVVVGVVVGYALTASTLHPWHWLGVMFLLPLLEIKKPLFWIATLSTGTYLAYAWAPAHSIALTIGWGGGTVGALALARRPLLSALMRARARAKWDRIAPLLPPVRPGGRLLDLGAGEGHVGDVAATELGLALTSLDVVTYAGGWRRVEVYDGEDLPYPDALFDATLIVFTLHHARDPRLLLREAVRVTRGPVLVLETVSTPSVPKAWLERVDRWANRLRSGGAIEEEPLNIRTDPDWRQVFRDEGLQFESAGEWGGLHPQALYRLRGQGATASSRDATVAVRASSQSA